MFDALSVEIGNRLKCLREAKGITGCQLAKEIGFDSAMVYRWESGKFSPGAFWLIKLADYFGCTVDDILGR